MKKYFVIAVRFDDEKKAQVKYIAGEFTEWFLASMFRDTYNKYFSANSEVVEESNLLNY